MRVLNLEFGSIHTSSNFGSHTLFHLATLSEAELDGIRHEIIEALESEGGYNKASLSKMRKLDSTLRECSKTERLSPPGYNIAVPLKCLHFDPGVYPEPEKFDCFRFSKLREMEESDVKYGFTTVEKNFAPFGLGRHACPGRFFASMELKIILSHMLLNYDISLPDGMKEAPKAMRLSTFVMPDVNACLVITPRVEQLGQDL
ncbi:hypothetical protein MVEN_01501300 [Mycena venus]|uniref:Cytochrome P450 n=1 Tax=Mycena venus TaxID=2733690 RepID=A0A8H6XTW8_9AGAR|nr:hypothetical protein MVEN_01501300 [Mycena venus]